MCKDGRQRRNEHKQYPVLVSVVPCGLQYELQ